MQILISNTTKKNKCTDTHMKNNIQMKNKLPISWQISISMLTTYKNVLLIFPHDPPPPNPSKTLEK